MKQVLFDRLQTNLAQCIEDGKIYFVKDANGNYNKLVLGDGSKGHTVGIGPKMDDETKQELMSKLGLTISTDMGTIHLGQLSPASGVSAQKTVIYERSNLGANLDEVANVRYVQQYMKTAQALVYAGLLNASTGEITSPNTTIIQNPSEGNLTLNSLLEGYEGETYLKVGMAFIVGTGGRMWYDKYPYIDVQGEEINVDEGDMIIITDVRHVDSEGDTPAHNEASIIIVQNNLEIFSGESFVDWAGGNGVTKAKQVYAFVNTFVGEALGNVTPLNAFSALQEKVNAIDGRVTALEGRVTTVEGNITTINGEISTIKSDLAAGNYSPKWSGE